MLTHFGLPHGLSLFTVLPAGQWPAQTYPLPSADNYLDWAGEILALLVVAIVGAYLLGQQYLSAHEANLSTDSDDDDDHQRP